jgi:hypothetical protein
MKDILLMSAVTPKNLKDIEYLSEIIYGTMHTPAFYLIRTLRLLQVFRQM